MTPNDKRAKLKTLAQIEGYATVLALLEAAARDSVSPGICICPDCDYATEVEGDQREGWCEFCDRGTVQSCLVLAGLI